MDRFIKTQDEIEKIAKGGELIRKILHETAALAKPGVSTLELDEYAEKAIRKIGGRPSFLGYGEKNNPFPATLCTSVNDVVVHGVPSSDVVLKEGDILGIDIGMEYLGLYTDTAITVGVGKVSAKAKKLMEVTKKSLDLAIRQAKPGNRIGDIAFATQDTVEKAGFSVVRELVGHGVGYEVHEDPQVPCYGKKGTGIVLKPGMVLAIEPMVCEGERFIFFDEDDGWSIRTRDGKLAAHFEHTIAVTERGARILT